MEALQMQSLIRWPRRTSARNSRKSKAPRGNICARNANSLRHWQMATSEEREEEWFAHVPLPVKVAHSSSILWAHFDVHALIFAMLSVHVVGFLRFFSDGSISKTTSFVWEMEWGSNLKTEWHVWRDLVQWLVIFCARKIFENFNSWNDEKHSIHFSIVPVWLWNEPAILKTVQNAEFFRSSKKLKCPRSTHFQVSRWEVSSSTSKRWYSIRNMQKQNGAPTAPDQSDQIVIRRKINVDASCPRRTKFHPFFR